MRTGWPTLATCNEAPHPGAFQPLMHMAFRNPWPIGSQKLLVVLSLARETHHEEPRD